jgi:hypothetical protein
MRTVFLVPRLNQASVVAGACCPVPAEALIVPELEAIPGVEEAAADWQTAQVIVQHAPGVSVEALAQVLSDLGYPAESSTRNTTEPGGVMSLD